MMRTPAAAAAPLLLSLVQTGHARGLGDYTAELRDELWQKVNKSLKDFDEDEGAPTDIVCGAGFWGDGPQCNQWDTGFSPCWPSALTVVAAWDTELMELWSAELAQEFGTTGRGQLGPGMNVARLAWNGRNGEYQAGEDPYFAAKMTAHMMKVYRTVKDPPLSVAKHFAPNTIENDRNQIIEEVDERTLFEVYYPPFAAAVDAGVPAIMCSYNLINCTSGVCNQGGVYACANDDILNKHLKDKMGFKGIVISDWDATKCQDKVADSPGCTKGGYIDNDFAADGGLDLEMPECMSFAGGVTKRAKEKKQRTEWAYQIMNRKAPGAGGSIWRRLDDDDEGSEEEHEKAMVLSWSAHPDKCLQVSWPSDKSVKAGLKIMVNECKGGSRDAFEWAEDGQIHWAAHPEFCFSIPTTTEGKEKRRHVIINDCTSEDALAFQPFDLEKGVGVLSANDVDGSELCLEMDWGVPKVRNCSTDLREDEGHFIEFRETEAPPKTRKTTTPKAKATEAPDWQSGEASTKASTEAPSWHTGVYDTNVFGEYQGDTSAWSSSSDSGEMAQGPTLDERCPDKMGDNYKGDCKLALAARIIAESTVVLRNEGGVLPLTGKEKVALVGEEACSDDPVAQGGGSGWNGMACNEVAKVNVADGISQITKGKEARVSCPTDGDDNSLAETADVILIVITPEKACEGRDRSTLQIHAKDKALIKKYSAMGPKVVVSINTPGPLMINTWDEDVDAITLSWLPGQQNGKGIAMALYNDTYGASGRLPFTFPKCKTQNCSKEDEYASVHLGDKIKDGSYLKFTEKALIGYRWYHAKQLEVGYPFGAGLVAYGAGQVTYTGVSAVESGSEVQVSATVTLNGASDVTSKDAPQLYLKYPSTVPGPAESKPEWVLKGFHKVQVTAGTGKKVTFALSQRDLSYWDDAKGMSKWVCAKGTFIACVGANAVAAINNAAACATFVSTCPSVIGDLHAVPLNAVVEEVEILSHDLTRTSSLASSVPVILGMTLGVFVTLAVLSRRSRQEEHRRKGQATQYILASDEVEA